MKNSNQKIYTLTLNDECDVLTSNETLEEILNTNNLGCHYILEFKYNANKLGSIYFYDQNYNFICQLKAKDIEKISLSRLKRLNLLDIKNKLTNQDNSKCYKESLIKLFLYKRFITQSK